MAADDPVALGEAKNGKNKGTLAIRLNYESRISYKVERKQGICYITMLKVCSHKDVYGVD